MALREDDSQKQHMKRGREEPMFFAVDATPSGPRGKNSWPNHLGLNENDWRGCEHLCGQITDGGVKEVAARCPGPRSHTLKHIFETEKRNRREIMIPFLFF